jgi:serine/threonine protein kinase
LSLYGSARNVYAIYGDENAALWMPPAHQEGDPFGADVGGVSEASMEASPTAAFDSWLTVGPTDGGDAASLGSMGIDWDSWTTDSGLTIDNGAVFWMIPNHGPTDHEVVVAQVTVSGAFTARVSAQGQSTRPSGADWKAVGITWKVSSSGELLIMGTKDGDTADTPAPGCLSGPCQHGGVCEAGEGGSSFVCRCPAGFVGNDCSTSLVKLSDGGTFRMAMSNSSGIPRDAYMCSCTPGFANGTCADDYVPEYEAACHLPFGGNCDLDVDECVSQPCTHNATCIESTTSASVPPDRYQCACPPGIAGGECSAGYLFAYQSRCHELGGGCDLDMNECISAPCRNDASCTESNNGGDIPIDKYRCSCAKGFVNGVCDLAFEALDYSGLCSVALGGNCDVDVDECRSTPCQNGGACSESSGDASVPANEYYCECTDDWSTIAATDCTDCHTGKYFFSGESRVGDCTDCSAGSYSATPGAVSCTNCTAGRFVSSEGAESAARCQYCVAGQASGEGAAQCELCEAGQASEQGAAHCDICEAGQFSEQAAAHCTLCVAGQFSNQKEGAAQCELCEAGQASEQGAAHCDICEAGQFSEQAATHCNVCTAGQFSHERAEFCPPCAAGTFSQGGATDCTACSGPTCYYPVEDTMVDCSGKQWVASRDQTKCKPCPPGKQPSSDRSQCDDCPAGTASEDGIQCLMCNSTKVNHNQSSVANDAQSACIPCGPGDEANPGGWECVHCRSSTYAPCSGSGCHICTPPFIVANDRTACLPAYNCPAASGCRDDDVCASIRDCEHCQPGAISAGGAPCKNCSDNGPGWVANGPQTACIQCPPGNMPMEDRSQCLTCQGDFISLLGSECQACSATQVVNQEHTKCEDCKDGEVAAHGVCACAAGFYNRSNAVIKCSDTCDIDETDVSSSTASKLHAEPASGCRACPPCMRCPTGANGLSSTTLIRPGFGLPHAWQGTASAVLIADSSVDKVTVYPCPLPEFCSGEHFEVERKFVTSANVDTVLQPDSQVEYKDWKKQLGSLIVAAGVRMEAASALSESTFGSSLEDLTIEQLTAILREYYMPTDPAHWGTEHEDSILIPGSRAIYSALSDFVVVPDTAIAVVMAVHSNATQRTRFSCAVGHRSAGPLCTLCENDFAGGSTNICKHCESSTTWTRVIVFLIGLVLLWIVLVVLPARLIKKARARMQSRQEMFEYNEFRLVGANTQRASAFVYAKIIVSHFQVLLQFPIVMDMDFPETFQRMLDWVGILKGDLLNYLSIKCAVKLNLYSAFGLSMLIAPCAFVCLIVVKITCSGRRGRVRVAPQQPAPSGNTSAPLTTVTKNRQQTPDKTSDDGLLNKMFVLLFCIYPFLSTRICHMFSCVKLHAKDNELEEWHRYDYSIDCAGTEYQGFRLIAVIMFVVYPVGVPAFAMWVFKRNWTRLYGLTSAPAAVVQQQRLTPSMSAAAKLPWWHGDRSTFYFMVRDYRPRFFYFEIVDFVRKFALTGLLMAGANRGSASQIVLGIMIAFGFGLLNATVQPYADSRTNVFRILADSSLLITLLIVLVLHFKAELGVCESLTEENLEWILIGSNFVLLFVAANQELLRRIFSLYFQTNLVGILYSPTGELADGAGDYATIYRGQYKATTSANAVPAAVKAHAFDPSIEAVEAALMLECEAHLNIVKLFKTERDGATSYVAMELGDRSVATAILAPEVTVCDRIAMCKAIAEGIQHLHKSGFVHGNVTPGNVVMFGNTPKLCGFSCAQVLKSGVVTEMKTMRGTRGYQPLEILCQKCFVTTEVEHPKAVDVFSLGCTMFFILSGGDEAFASSVQKDVEQNVELNILSGASGVEQSNRVPEESKRLIHDMLRAAPPERLSLDAVLSHPLFWMLDEKVQYLGEAIGSLLPIRVHKSEHSFVTEIERIVDENLGAYDEHAPEAGGSWSRCLDDRYPLTGNWGSKSGQRPPHEEEHNYFTFGAPPSKKEGAERERQLKSGKLTKQFAAKVCLLAGAVQCLPSSDSRCAQPMLSRMQEIRTVGLLKFMRNIHAHRSQQIQAGRFESEEALCTYLLAPFPFLLMAVYEADERHRLTPRFQHVVETKVVAEKTSFESLARQASGETQEAGHHDNPILGSWSSTTMEESNTNSQQRTMSADSENL